MNKIIAAGTLSVLLITGVASAQSYGYSPVSTGTCVILTSDLSRGSRGSEVSDLQRFLVAQNYPGGGSWMVTGYFGSATAAAVMNFQQSVGLAQTGAVDGSTRSAIQSRTCGGAYNYSYPNQYSYNNQYPYNQYTYSNTTPYLPIGQAGIYPYNYNNYNNYTYSGTLSISSLSLYSGVPGSVITIYGSGFQSYNNTVHFGSTNLNATSNGSTLQFTVPYVSAGSYQVYVSNTLGISNSMSFMVTGGYQNYQYGGSCGTGYYGASNNCCGFGFGSAYSCGPVTLAYLSPISGGVGAAVTIYGSGFSGTGNTVHFGLGIVTNLSSLDGQAISFTVPTVLTGYGSQQVQIGSYPISVTNAQGATSNTLAFNVTSIAGGVAPTITGVTGPTSLSTGAQGTWTLNLSAPFGSYMTTSVNWGDQGLYGSMTLPQTNYGQGQQALTFTHAYSTSGTYTITFTVSGPGGTNTTTATVAVTGSASGSPALTFISPSSGSVGTTVTLQGSGFTSDNTVLFGSGAIVHVASSNATVLTFTVPTVLNPLCYYYGCGVPSQSTTPGTYSVSVQNSNGTSNATTFTVL